MVVVCAHAVPCPSRPAALPLPALTHSARRRLPPACRIPFLAHRRDQNASFLALRDVAATKALYPGIQDLTKWCAKNKEAIAKLA